MSKEMEKEEPARQEQKPDEPSKSQSQVREVFQGGGLTKGPTEVPGKARPRDGHRGSAGSGAGGRQGT